jgi:hypothetical protein
VPEGFEECSAPTVVRTGLGVTAWRQCPEPSPTTTATVRPDGQITTPDLAIDLSCFAATIDTAELDTAVVEAQDRHPAGAQPEDMICWPVSLRVGNVKDINPSLTVTPGFPAMIATA